MAEAAHKRNPESKFSYISKDKKLVGEKPQGEWILIDDVKTTGESLREAIAIIGVQPNRIIVAVDRCKGMDLPKVSAIFEP